MVKEKLLLHLQKHHAVDRPVADKITACDLLCEVDLFGLILLSETARVQDA